MPTLAIARVLHEGNSLSPVLTPLENFVGHEWSIGAAAHAAYRGTDTELGGAITWLAPGVFDAIIGRINNGLKDRRVVAAFVSLHGSLNATE